jgi:hypothetical protein
MCRVYIAKADDTAVPIHGCRVLWLAARYARLMRLSVRRMYHGAIIMGAAREEHIGARMHTHTHAMSRVTDWEPWRAWHGALLLLLLMDADGHEYQAMGRRGLDGQVVGGWWWCCVVVAPWRGSVRGAMFDTPETEHSSRHRVG